MTFKTLVGFSILYLIIFNNVGLSGQDLGLEWGKSIGGNQADYGGKIITDNQKNVVATGYFEGTVDLNPNSGVHNVTASASTSAFIQKLDSSGNFIWAYEIPVGIYQIATDDSNNILISGNFYGTVDFDLGPASHILSSFGVFSGFIAKYDYQGHLIWVKKLTTSSNGSSNVYSFAIDDSSNLFMVGTFRDTVDFDPSNSTYNIVNSGTTDLFVLKLNQSGNFNWVKTISSSNIVIGQFININLGGDLLITGYFDGLADFDPGIGINNLTSIWEDIFILKLSSSGSFINVKSYGGNGYERCYGISFDQNGNMYSTGEFSDSADFDPGITEYKLYSNGGGDYYVQKLDSSGNFLWAKQFGGTNNDYVSTIANDISGNVIISGRFSGSVDFDPSSNNYTLSANGSDIFIQKLDSNSNFIWTKKFGSNGYYQDNSRTIHITEDNEIYLTGSYFNSMNISPSTTPNYISSNGNRDVFLLKLKECNNNSTIDTIVACNHYTWVNGITYTSSINNVSYTLPNSSGCDSTITLNLMVYQNDTITQNITVCDQYTWIDGVNYTSSNNTATQTFTNVNGCDSIVQLNLIINSSNTGIDYITACDNYTWVNGITYSSNTIATHTLTNSAGCDSIVTLNLTINDSSTSTDTIISCDHYTWIDGVTYSSNNNIATHTLTNSTGCDSIITLNLTILNSATSINTIATCDSTTWIDGITYSTSNNTATYTFIGGAQNGCDSVIYLDLTILSNSSTNIITACDNYSWIDGITYTASNNSATHILTNSHGCDSLIHLDLTINYSNWRHDTVVSCDQYTWIDGITYTTNNNTSTHTLINNDGCDSIIYLHLTINNSNNTIDTIQACNSYIWIDGNTYTSNNNTATHTLINSFGCDSIITLNLTMSYNTVYSDVYTVCDSLIWIDGNTYYSNNNTATHIIMGGTANGCDSIIYLDLTVLSNSSTDTITACNSYTWIDGNIYTVSDYSTTYTLTNSHGCDSLIHLNLTINYSNSTIDTIISCNHYTWIDGITYTSSNNTATFTLINSVGCDSVISLDLTIHNSNANIDTIVSCNNYTWINGITYTSNNNTATYTLSNSVGCDSMITLNLTITPSTYSTDSYTVCDSITWINGLTYYSSNNTATYIIPGGNSFGCDSIINLNLTVHHSDSSIQTISSCNNFTWINGINYTTNNDSASYLLTNSYGCDSLVFLNLTINYPDSTTQIVNACDDYTWINGITYTTSNNTANHTLTNVNGCDSVITLNLNMNYSSNSTDIVTACQNYTWIDGNIYTSNTSNVTHNLLNANGCDSIVLLDLIIIPVDTSVIRQGHTLHAQANNASYQWINCNTSTYIDGQTNANYNITESGLYSVEITQNNCIDTSSCFLFTNVGVSTLIQDNHISIYPNPTSDLIHIDIKSNSNNARLRVIDSTGRQIITRNIKKDYIPWITTINMNNLVSGIYYLEIIINNQSMHYPISKL